MAGDCAATNVAIDRREASKFAPYGSNWRAVQSATFATVEPPSGQFGSRTVCSGSTYFVRERLTKWSVFGCWLYWTQAARLLALLPAPWPRCAPKSGGNLCRGPIGRRRFRFLAQANLMPARPCPCCQCFLSGRNERFSVVLPVLFEPLRNVPLLELPLSQEIPP